MFLAERTSTKDLSGKVVKDIEMPKKKKMMKKRKITSGMLGVVTSRVICSVVDSACHGLWTNFQLCKF